MKPGISMFLAGLMACAALASGALADEIWLKDGSKIVGTIVGYEEVSFKVSTSYGFAMVRKDSILEILPGDAKSAAPKAASEKPAETSHYTPTSALSAETRPPAPVKPATASAVASTPVPVAPQPASWAAPIPAPGPRSTAAPPKAVPPPAVKTSALPPVPAAIAPAAPAPPVVQEFVRGNLYINQTYGFQMFRPPGWELVQDAVQALPNAITALGTGDETTLLLVSRDISREGTRGRDPLDVQAAATGRTLNTIYENYRLLKTNRTVVAGVPAIEQHARGLADEHDWSVVILTFGRDSEVFTVLGMTYADSDLIQIRENVIARMIASLRFTPPPAR